jgi:hypothetical protein
VSSITSTPSMAALGAISRMDSDVWKSELSVFVSAKNVNMDIRIRIRIRF